VFVAAGSVVLLAACGGTTGEETDSGTEGSDGESLPLIYGAFATPLEEPWDGAIHAALESAADDGEIEYKYIDELSTSDAMERTLRDIATNEEPDAIIGDAFAAEEAVRTVAAEFPDIPFAFGSGEPPVEPNMSVFDNWLQDPAYLAGMLSGGLTESNVIGVVGAMPIPEVNRIVNAYVEGAREVNPEVEVKVSFINTFFDPAAAKQAAEAQIAAGADVLFAERDGVIAAAEEADIPVVGMMVDQKEDAPGHVVTSLIWNMRPTVDQIIEQAIDGPEAVDLGEYSFMNVGGSELAEINTDVVGGVPADLVEQVETRQQEIMDGDFVTPVDEEPPAGSIDASQQ
jgi:basic membrane lipoprotein Med (substrate-binding protein (PBP1-ABC) superfamily)